jgi:L-fuculose-phosphate aldolase
VATSLGNNHALFLQNHGSLVVGKSIREATILALLLERACKLQIIAESLRMPYAVSSDEDVKGKKGFIYDDTAIKTYWDYSVRKINQLNLNNWKSLTDRENL